MTVTMTRPASASVRSPGQPPPQWLGDSIELDAVPAAVPLARARARRLLKGWGLRELADDTEQIVSELVTNAVEAHQHECLDAPARLTLIAGLRTVLVVVRDAASGKPRLGSPGDDHETGRGLIIVDTLAAYWDTKSHPGGGKVVRALVRGTRRGARDN